MFSSCRVCGVHRSACHLLFTFITDIDAATLYALNKEKLADHCHMPCENQ